MCGHTTSAQVIVGIDQDDVVVHYDPSQRDHTDTTHNDPEGAACDQQAKQHARNRKDDRRHHDEGLVKVVELGQQNHKHQQDRRGKSAHQKDHRIHLVLGFAAKGPRHTVGKVHLFQRGAQGNNLIIDQHVGGDVGINRHNAVLINAVDCACAR